MLMPIRILRTCVTGLPHPVTLFCVHQCFNSPVPGRWLHATKQPQNQRPHHEATHQPRRALDHHLPPSHRRSPVLSFFAFDHRAFVSRALGPRAIIREATTEAPPPPLKRVVCDSCNIAQPKQRFLFRIGRRKKIMFIFKKARLKKFVGLKPNRSPYIPA